MLTGRYPSDRNPPKHRDILFVECKDHGCPVGVEAVRSFYSVLADLADVRGLVVARAGFTSKAKLFATSKARLTLSTYAELELNTILDPANYLRGFVGEYPTTQEASTYVELSGTTRNGEDVSSVEDGIVELLAATGRS